MNQEGLRLYAVYLGGKAPRANIELHDVVFVVGHTLTDTYPKLKKKWFGYPTHTPHIDSYIELTAIDGFQISVTRGNDTKKSAEHKLYFVNFGAYSEALFGEIHQSAFFVAKDKAEATHKARQSLCVGMTQSHLDDHLEVEGALKPEGFEVDDLLEIENIDGYQLKFLPAAGMPNAVANPGYIKLK